METIQIIFKGDLSALSRHMKSGVEIMTDAPVDNQGKGSSFSPTDLLAASLGCCMMTIMAIASKTHQINLEGTTIGITKIMASEPRRVKEIQVDFHFPNINYTEKEKAILEKAARTCPVAMSLHPELTQTIHFNYQ